MIRNFIPCGLAGALSCTLAVFFSGLAELRAQVQVGTVELQNFRPAAGLAWVDVVLPLAQGRFKTTPALQTSQGRVCEVTPMGARWPDGSLRYLKLDLPVQVQASERLQVRVETRKVPAPVFRWHKSVAAGLQKLRLRLWIAGQVVHLGALKVMESGGLVQVLRSRVRAKNSAMYGELYVIAGHDTPTLRFHLIWGNSSPATPTLTEDPGMVVFQVDGVDVELDNPAKSLASEVVPGGGRRYLLHRGGNVGDGQSQHLEGQLLFAGPGPRVRGLAHGWADSRAYGPFGELVPEARIKQKAWDDILRHDQKVLVKHPWAPAVHGCNPEPHNTGNQSDFGVVVMREDILRRDPARLEWIAHSVYQEWLRPTHFKELDLSPVKVANHPKWITRSGRSDFRAATWVDTLGKPNNQYQLPPDLAKDHLGRPWRGHDAEHLSINYLCAFALLTGDRLAFLECQNQIELWLSRFTHNSGTFNDDSGPARGEGRALMAGCWLYLLTGRKDLRVRLGHRIQALKRKLNKPRSAIPAKLPGVLQPRFRSNIGWFWPPWEEAIAAVGSAAVYSLIRDLDAAQIAQVLSDNVVRHGIGWTKRGFRCGYQLPFELPSKRPYFALADPTFESSQASGPGLTIWTLSAVTLAAHYSADKIARPLAHAILMDLLNDKIFLGEGDVLRWIAVIPRHLN